MTKYRDMKKITVTAAAARYAMGLEVLILMFISFCLPPPDFLR